MNRSTQLDTFTFIKLSALRWTGIASCSVAVATLAVCHFIQPLPAGEVLSSFALYPATANTFTLGMIVAGLLLSLWGIWLIDQYRAFVPAWLVTLTRVAFVSLIGLAVFPTTASGFSLQRALHWTFALTFLYGTTLSLGLIAYYSFRNSPRSWIILNLAFVAIVGGFIAGYAHSILGLEIWACAWLVVLVLGTKKAPRS